MNSLGRDLDGIDVYIDRSAAIRFLELHGMAPRRQTIRVGPTCLVSQGCPIHAEAGFLDPIDVDIHIPTIGRLRKVHRELSSGEGQTGTGIEHIRAMNRTAEVIAACQV